MHTHIYSHNTENRMISERERERKRERERDILVKKMPMMSKTRKSPLTTIWTFLNMLNVASVPAY